MTGGPLLNAARGYRRRGWQILPLRAHGKAPHPSVGKRWTNFRCEENDLEEHFGTNDRNIGVLLGEPSGGLVDVDLDCAEAVALADQFLPTTGAIFGRQGAPRSHRIYVCKRVEKTERYQAPGGPTLVELRGRGGQTMFPPSVHPKGEAVEWASEEEPATVERAELERGVRRLAAAALLARTWPEKGARQDTALALSGALLRGGWSLEETEGFVAAVARVANDEEAETRVECVRATARKLDSNESVTGIPKLAELCGEPQARRVSKWLGLRGSNTASGPATPIYRFTPDGIVWEKPSRDGPVSTFVTNFTARIRRDVTRDNGVEKRREFEVEATLKGVSSTFTVSASSFASMSWPVEHLGVGAVVFPGQSAREHARVAIQTNSSPERLDIYEHTGWRRIGDKLVYLHHGGAIGPEGPETGVHTDLGELRGYEFPDPPTGEARVTAVRSFLLFLELSPRRIAWLLLATVVRAVLGGTDFTLWLLGPTGVFKSVLAALIQAAWGRSFTHLTLPASWEATANYLEAQASLAADAVLVIDDYAPGSTRGDAAQLHRKAQRLVRAQGNRSGRGRMNADSSLRSTLRPRGTLVSTGEDVPAGQSVYARMMVSEIGEGDVDERILKQLQDLARAGVLAAGMAAYIQHIAAHYDSVQEHVSLRQRALRADAQSSEIHRRTPEIVAQLQVGVEVFTSFLGEVGAIDHDEVSRLREECWATLGEAARAQHEHIQSSEPTERFRDLLNSAISSGSAYVESVAGGAPSEGAEGLGWNWRDAGGLESQGKRIGWIDSDNIYLDPNVAYDVAMRMAGEGPGVGVQVKTLAKRLAEKKLLLSTDTSRRRNTVRRTIQERRRSVLHLHVSFLGVGAQQAQEDHGDFEEPLDGGHGPETWAPSAGSGVITGPANGPTGGDQGDILALEGPDGPIGPKPEEGTASPGRVGWSA